MALLNNQIRVRFGYNSEKSLNNSRFLNILEVENKSATLYSSKRARGGSRKAENYFSLPLSPFSFQLIWTLTRPKEE
jgi:hypothetical protein